MMNAVGPHSTSDEIKAAIASLTAALCGPMSNVERTLIVDDRNMMKAELARRAAAGSTK